MITWIGVKTVRISAIKLPGDMAARRMSDRVRELAKSIDASGGPIHFPTVCVTNMRLCSGCDRIAALMELGRTNAEVRFFQSDDDGDFRRLALIENVFRRKFDDIDGQRAEYYALVKQDLAAQPVPVDEPAGPGRPRDVAMDVAAADLGISARTLRRSIAEASDGDGANDCPEEPKEPTIELWGAPAARYVELSARAEAAQGLIAECERGVRALLTVIRKLSGAPFPHGRLQALESRAKQLAHDITASRPVAVCPWCKGVPERSSSCNACQGHSYIVESQSHDVPPQLKRRDAVLSDAGIAIDPRLA